MWIWLMFGWSWSPCSAVSFDWGLVCVLLIGVIGSVLHYPQDLNEMVTEKKGRIYRTLWFKDSSVQSLLWRYCLLCGCACVCTRMHTLTYLSCLHTVWSLEDSHHSVHFIASAHALKLYVNITRLFCTALHCVSLILAKPLWERVQKIIPQSF